MYTTAASREQSGKGEGREMRYASCTLLMHSERGSGLSKWASKCRQRDPTESKAEKKKKYVRGYAAAVEARPLRCYHAFPEAVAPRLRLGRCQVRERDTLPASHLGHRRWHAVTASVRVLHIAVVAWCHRRQSRCTRGALLRRVGERGDVRERCIREANAAVAW